MQVVQNLKTAIAALAIAALVAVATPLFPQHAFAADGGRLAATPCTALATQSTKTTPIPSKKGKATIAKVKSSASIEADVKLSGKGTGCHAKLVICTPTSAVSFGLQYDKFARDPYGNKTMAMIENVKSNDPGGQQYLWPKNLSASMGKYYHLMLTLNKNGKGSVYINGIKVGSFNNPGLKNQQVYLRVEGAARKNGDTVKATFKNIKLKTGGSYNKQRFWSTHEFTSNGTIKATKATAKAVTIAGKISGFPADVDWDSAGYYDKASGIIQFVG